MFIRFVPVVALVLLVSSLAHAQTPAPTPQNFEKTLAGSMARMLRIQDLNVRALMREGIRRDGSLLRPVLSPDGMILLYRDSNWKTHGLRIVKGVVNQIVFPPRTIERLPSRRTFDPDEVDSRSGAFSPDGRLYAGWRQVKEDRDGRLLAVSLFDTRTWKVVRVLPAQSNTISSIAFSHDGKRLIGGNMAGGAAIYDAASGKILSQWHYKNNYKQLFVAFAQTPTGEKAVALTNNRYWSDLSDGEAAATAEAAQLWDIEANEKLVEFPQFPDVRTASFNSDGSQIAMIQFDPALQPGGPLIPKMLVTQWAAQPLPSARYFSPVEILGGEGTVLWTPDDKNLISVGMGTGDDWFQVFDLKAQTPTHDLP